MTCPFCNLAPDVPRIKETRHAFAILSANPIHALHTLVVPRPHVEQFPELSVDVATDVWLLARAISAVLRDEDGVDGITHLSDDSFGDRALNQVSHYKFHLIPRTADEKSVLTWHRWPTPDAAIVQERVARLRDRLK
jgi:diadenosine tetraphosphate (Ap4A) HIT family hydrolase